MRVEKWRNEVQKNGKSDTVFFLNKLFWKWPNQCGEKKHLWWDFSTDVHIQMESRLDDTVKFKRPLQMARHSRAETSEKSVGGSHT